MSTFISDFKASGGGWATVHDDALGGTHTGTIAPTDVAFNKDPMDGSANYREVVITCPVCQCTSTAPIGGGAQPRTVQEMIVRHFWPPIAAVAAAAIPVNLPTSLYGYLASQPVFAGSTNV